MKKCCSTYSVSLTYLPQDKMFVLFADDISLNEKFCISIQSSIKFVPKGPIDDKWVLVQVMAWHHTDSKLLSEPMLTQFTDAYMPHQGEMS